MAKVTYKMPEDFLTKVSKLSDKTEIIIPKVLEQGASVVEHKVKSNLKSVVGKGTLYESRSSGKLLDALGVSPVMVDRKGDYDIKIGFSEPRSDGESNAKIATIIEYGKSGQLAKPFLKPAKMSSKKECIATMSRVLEEEISKL